MIYMQSARHEMVEWFRSRPAAHGGARPSWADRTQTNISVNLCMLTVCTNGQDGDRAIERSTVPRPMIVR